MRPPRPSPTPATLKRVALAKLTGILRISAAFSGQRLVFEPWLTLLVDSGRGAFLAGVYRTDSDPDGPGTPRWCLRKSEWLREADVEMSGAADDLREHLLNGPQIASRLVFADRLTHPEVEAMTEDALAVLGSGVTLVPMARTHEWHEVELDLADDRLICTIAYSPLLARSEAVETALPPWIERLDALLRRDGIPPDGKVRVTIRRSVPELVRG
jgi:hypothetical protein